MAPAGIGWRIVALLIDGVVYLILTFCIVTAAVAAGRIDETIEADSGLALALNAVSIVTILVYFTLLEAAAGITLGKKIVGLRVVRMDGSPIGFRESIIRNVLRLVDGQPAGTFLVAVILVVLTPDNQRLGDLAAKTMVVRESSAGIQSPPSQTPTAGSPPPSSPF